MKHLFKFIELLAAVLISGILFPFALIFNVILIFRFKLKFARFLIKFLVEIFKLTFDLFEKIAVIIDRLGNVILGNLFIYIFIYKEYKYRTLFNKSEITISASLGHGLINGFLNSKGIKFSNFIDNVFGKDHCINAYKFDLIKIEFNNKTGIS